ncbi:MAG TPA: cation-translocating P-type ATPase [Elainellaceae cyanobacterium]
MVTLPSSDGQSDPLPDAHTTPWHALDIEKALTTLDSDRQKGLTSDNAAERLRQYGLNELDERGGRSRWTIILDQFKNIMLLMLIAVAIISAILDIRHGQFPKDAIAILLIVGLNGILGYLQESRAEEALAALKQLASPSVRVLRDDRIVEIDAKNLVPGDIMLLEAGVQVAADGRLVDEANLQVRESALTGEAESVNKDANLVLSDDTALGDRLNLAFQGTEVVQGRAKVLVTRTGMETELGQIATMLKTVESEPTPLQRRMTQLGNVLVSGSLILVAIVVIGGVLYAGMQQFEAMLEVSLSMAVAVVPEGLPAVITVTLALGTQRMVKRNALIRKLPAVETLGSVTTICSDKTGTLTQNKMVVQEVYSGDRPIRVTGEGYEPTGSFHRKQSASQIGQASNPFPSDQIVPREHPSLYLLLLACTVCNDAVLQKERGEWAILGDPTEGALLALAGKAEIEQNHYSYALPRVAEVPFSSERKRMSVIVKPDNTQHSADGAVKIWETTIQSHDYLLFTKGSPELVLERCRQWAHDETASDLTEGDRQRILKQNNQMASQGLRVLGFAYKPLSEAPSEEDAASTEHDLIWLGLVGMLDAPRPEVRNAVAKCRQAGIRPMMITGDHQLTARAIATDLGIAQPNAPVLNGHDLEILSKDELEAEVKRVNVYARVAPEHKLRIVQALQHQGNVVAMTGDGVNDAPALKQADIGIAMGITGTDVSKEASDMVLLDDNFASIVAATEEGRVVYTNIRRFVKYILGSNIGEVITIAASPILVPMGGVPLTPLQILWMNLVTDGVPALALAVEPAEPDVMNRPPYDPNESIFARGLGAYMIRIGIVFSIITITLMVLSYDYTQMTSGDPDRWKTMVFTTLCIAQMGHAIAVRSNSRLTIEMNPFSNPFVWGAVVLTTVLQLMLIYVPPLRNFFGTEVLSASELLICFGFSSLMFIWVELEKLFVRWYQGRK